MNTKKGSIAIGCLAVASVLLWGCHPPDIAMPHLEAGGKLFDSGQPDAAIAELQTGLRLNPNHAGGHLVLGRAYAQKKDYTRCEAEYRTAIRLDPQWVDPYICLGQCLTFLHRYDEALATLNTALQLAPADPSAHYYLGNALVKVGRRAEARQHWQTAAQSGVARVAGGAQKQLDRYP